jgi:chromosome segregation ATPase
MENMFVWILVFAGATIGLLGTFLIASERELKKTRREANEMAARINCDQSADSESRTLQPADTQIEAETELIARNKELADEVASLSNRLQLSQTSGEALAAVQQELAASQLENAALQESNRQLRDEMALAKSQLDISHTELGQSREEHEDVAARYAQFEKENASLKDELEQCRCKIMVLENTQTRWSDIESRESLMKEEQQRLENEITELNKEITVGRESLQELETTRAQLKESETLRRQLVEDNQRLEQEISRWQERLAGSEEQRRRLSTVRQNLETLKTKQAAVGESHRQLQEELDAIARFVDTPESNRDATSPITIPETASPSNGQDTLRTELNHGDLTAEPLTPFSAPQTNLAPETANTPGARKRRFSIFPVMVALAIGGGAVGSLLR